MPSFEPFTDRLSRDIRNDLSEAFAHSVTQGSLDPAREVAATYRRQDLASCYEQYIADRMNRYGQALARYATGPDDVLWQGLVLWDLGLFFEVHEILEQAWMTAADEEKTFLQAMIRAAGAYIKLAHGYDGPAGRLAAKAVPVLEAHRQRLARFIDPDLLIRALQAGPASTAPTLLPPVS